MSLETVIFNLESPGASSTRSIPSHWLKGSLLYIKSTTAVASSFSVMEQKCEIHSRESPRMMKSKIWRSLEWAKHLETEVQTDAYSFRFWPVIQCASRSQQFHLYRERQLHQPLELCLVGEQLQSMFDPLLVC